MQTKSKSGGFNKKKFRKKHTFPSSKYKTSTLSKITEA